MSDYIFISKLIIPPNISKTTELIADTGCSGHCDGFIQHATPAVSPIHVCLPNGGSMTSTHTHCLNIPSLPPEACRQHLFPAMTTTGLLSIGQLCDHGCTAIFSKRHLAISNAQQETIILGHRVPMWDANYTNGMWMVNLPNINSPPPTLHSANAIILADTTQRDLANLHHASLGSPVKSTLVDAIDSGFLSTFPGLTKFFV